MFLKQDHSNTTIINIDVHNMLKNKQIINISIIIIKIKNNIIIRNFHKDN